MRYAGIAACDSCNARYRISAEQAVLEGKLVRCPRCHEDFTLAIQRPSLAEQAAMDATPTPRRRRRTKAEIRAEHLEQIRSAFRSLHPRISQVAEQRSSEEEVRRWCVDVLRDALGYEDQDIDTELSALNRRIDVAILDKGKVMAVIECKNTRSRLPEKVRDQAVAYAQNKMADWAVVTNGDIWRLYRVVPIRGHDPRTVKVFDIGLLDEDGLSDDDVESLYLLSKRALLTGDTERVYHHTACTSEPQLLQALASERVTMALRRELLESYETTHGQKVRLDREDVADRVRELFLPADL